MLLALWPLFMVAKPSGGHDQYHVLEARKHLSSSQIAERVRLQRIALGIIPDRVAKIVNKVAANAIAKATKSHTADVAAWAIEQQAYYDSRIKRELERHNLVWDMAYRSLFELAVIEALQDEELAVLMLLNEL